MNADPPDTFEERVRCCLRCHVEAHAFHEPALETECDHELERLLSDQPDWLPLPRRHDIDDAGVR